MGAFLGGAIYPVLLTSLQVIALRREKEYLPVRSREFPTTPARVTRLYGTLRYDRPDGFIGQPREALVQIFLPILPLLIRET
jgi:hypothetical protein